MNKILLNIVEAMLVITTMASIILSGYVMITLNNIPY